MDRFRVNQIDQPGLFVPDPHEAEAWYEKVFGLELATYEPARVAEALA